MKRLIFITFLTVFSLGIAIVSADQITLQNGDILNGKVLVLTTNTLVLQDDSLGKLTLPRAKISNITFGSVATAAPVPANTQPALNSNSDLAAVAREIRQHTNLVQEVEAQVLGSSASPAAVSKLNEMLDELGSGQMDMNGLRSEAQSAADQLKEYKKEMGQDSGAEVDTYLAILNHFLSETAPTNSVSP